MNVIFQILLLLSKLPMRILYVFSDLFFFIIYYIIGYRKKVVLENLRHSFPNKTDKDIKKIGKAFFWDFSDYIVEMLKSFSISDRELLVRVQHLNRQVFFDAKAEGKNVIMLSGHVFNWEWFNSFAKHIPQEHSYPVYRKMQNAFWNQKILKIRNRFGNHAIEDREFVRHIFKNPNDGNSTYMLVADQSPMDASVGIKFLNQNTPVFIGYDKLATRLDLAFIYCEMKKVKRGFYQVNYHRIYPTADKFTEYEVVKKYYQLLENTIHKHPDNWLWSHKRWKRKDQIKELIS